MSQISIFVHNASEWRSCVGGYHKWRFEIQKSYWIWNFICFNFLLLYLFKNRWKEIIHQLKKYLKISEFNQRLRLSANVPVAVSSSSTSAYICRWTFWNIHSSFVSQSWKKTSAKTKKISNIQSSLFFTVCLFDKI